MKENESYIQLEGSGNLIVTNKQGETFFHNIKTNKRIQYECNGTSIRFKEDNGEWSEWVKPFVKMKQHSYSVSDIMNCSKVEIIEV